MQTTAPSTCRPTRRWPRRHPAATAVLVVAAAIFGLMLAFPGEESRGILFLGILVLATPIAIVVLLVTWLIDRRRARSVAVAEDEPAAYTAPVWPPAAPSVTPRDASTLWRSERLAGAPPPVDAPPAVDTPPSVDAPSPAGASPLEETARLHLADRPAVDPNRYQPARLGDLLEMSAAEFEQLCVRVLLNLGYTDVRRTGSAGDLGADVVGKDPQGRSIIVQCKRYAPGNAVGSPTLQTFIGMKTVHHKADRGIVMTTAEFSRPAVQLALEHDIVLIDGDDIVKVLNLMGSR